MNPYIKLMRFDKPIGTMLLLWPTWIALLLASNGTPTPKNFIIFTLGVIIMRAAGCVINDFADRKLDLHVERTKNRPLAKKLIPPQKALILFCFLSILAFLLVLNLNTLTIAMSFLALSLATLYPFCKRFTNYPQLILAFAYSFGILMSYTAVLNQITFESIILYFGFCCWTIAYDTQYAMVDKNDDLKIGIKSTAISFGKLSQIIISILQTIFIASLIYIGISRNFDIYYFLCLLISSCLFLYQGMLIKTSNTKKFFKSFKNNNFVGLIIYVGILTNLAIS